MRAYEATAACKDMVFYYQNCSNRQWERIVWEKLLKFEAEGREFAKIFSITRTISSHNKSEQFW